MTANLKKALLIGLGIFVVVIVSIAVVYLVRKPTPVAQVLPTPAPFDEPTPSAVVAPVFEVTPVVNKCETDIVVACAQQHHVCDTTTKACKLVEGAGEDTCTEDIDCTEDNPTHHVCDTTTKACKEVAGAGADTCNDNADCAETPSAALQCMSKKMYEDDSRNKSGFYYMEKEITDTNTLSNGQIILYNITTKNTGGFSVPDTTITDKLSTNLTYVDGDSGCTYDSATRTVTCVVGSLAASSEAQRSFRTKVTVSGTQSVANTAEVSSTNGQRDSCSVNISASGIVTTPPPVAPTALPVAGVFEVTAGTVGIGFFLLIAGALGLLLI